MIVPCYICHIPVEESDKPDAKLVRCPRCGDYTIVGTACSMLSAKPLLSASQIGCAAGWVREHRGTEIRSEEVRLLRDLPSPSPDTKAIKLLAALAKLSPTPGHKISLSFSALSSSLNRRMDHPSPTAYDGDEATGLALMAAAWAANHDELWFLLVEYLVNTQKHVRPVGQGSKIFMISPEGWAYLAGFNPNSIIGFIAMWFDKRLDPVLAAIEKGIGEAGYDPKRIDKVEHNNKIDDEIIAWIRRSKFVVADMTGNRGGVYFESGFALGLDLEVIWLCRKDRLHRVHFDNRQYNFIEWSSNELPALTQRLKNRIEARFGKPA